MCEAGLWSYDLVSGSVLHQLQKSFTVSNEPEREMGFVSCPQQKIFMGRSQELEIIQSFAFAQVQLI